MAPNVGSPRCLLFVYAVQFLVVLLQSSSKVLSYEYKVGDLSGWGIPPASDPNVYTKWAKNNAFGLGDSLFFLYPPSEDSVIQVTPQSYKSCNIKDPILQMNNGNSLFNITKIGEYYFTSGESGHCTKGQKLHISVSGNGTAIAYPPSADGPSSAMSDTAEGPATPNFGSIPAASSAFGLRRFEAMVVSLIGLASMWAVMYC